jgi:hypothetical protein
MAGLRTDPRTLEQEKVALYVVMRRRSQARGQPVSASTRCHHKPVSVGSLEIYGDRIVVLISIPMDALPPILSMMIGDRFKFVAMGGTKFWHRKSRLHSLRLEMNMEEEDIPPADDELS